MIYIATSITYAVMKRWPGSSPRRLMLVVNVVNIDNETYLGYVNFNGVFHAGNQFASCVNSFHQNILLCGNLSHILYLVGW